MFSGFSSPSHPTSLTADEFGKWLSLNIEVSDIIRLISLYIYICILYIYIYMSGYH